MLTKSRVVQLLFMMVVLLSLFFWRTFDENTDKEALLAVESESQASLLRCDYSEACEFITEQGEYLLNVKNLPIKAEEWIDFELTMPIAGLKVIKAQIVSKSMFMGRIPVTFKKSATQTFSTKALVGACTTPEMIWEMEVTVDKEGFEEVITFDFMVKR
tara:strand:- start:4869 stop:5345 length:477 start_codon:yes stop_codon:yes gene_type:complete